MLEVKILIAPGLILRVPVRAEWIAHFFRFPVPLHNVFVKGIIGSQVETAAEPPCRPAIFFIGDEKPEIRVRGGHIRVARMQYQ
jgi:hypothetical protein